MCVVLACGHSFFFSTVRYPRKNKRKSQHGPWRNRICSILLGPICTKPQTTPPSRSQRISNSSSYVFEFEGRRSEFISDDTKGEHESRTEFQVPTWRPSSRYWRRNLFPFNSFFIVVVFQDAAALFQEISMDFFVCSHIGEENCSFTASY